MNKLISFIVLIIFCSAQAQEASEIIKLSEDHLRGESSTAEISIEIERRLWSRTIDIKVWSLGSDYSLILMQAPIRDKGTVYLKRKKEIWNWQPKIKKIIKLPPSMMMQSWMGSDFTNDDLVKESSVLFDYTNKIIGDTLLLGLPCCIIELLPKPDAPVVWGKIKLFIDLENYLQLATEFYDEDGYLINKMKVSEIKTFGNRVLPSLLTMTSVEEKGQRTILRYKSIDFNTGIMEDFFTKENMKKVH
ncbi:MAG: Uncharacterised protein [Flavobacteriaceae bacterium]|nr:MAG: Uncharacterised protein [Flavobacteriaceae bacterium]|tara:strand:+ start:2902 stop:3642 length:741 start_codon:yes stop_codon:yes gene_type:complete